MSDASERIGCSKLQQNRIARVPGQGYAEQGPFGAGAGRYPDTERVFGLLSDIAGVFGRDSDTQGPPCVRMSPDNELSVRMSPENASGVRISPGNPLGVRSHRVPLPGFRLH